MTVFQEIIDGELPCERVYEDDFVLAFKDIAPKAPIHILIIPKKAIRDIQSVASEDIDFVGAMVAAAQKIASDLDITDGYRLVINNGAKAGQTVFHLHMHLLAGKEMDIL